MELKISHEEGCVLVRWLGSIDESAKPLFSEHVRPLLAEQGTKFVLDLSEANFITSAGIGNLVALAADANLRGSRVSSPVALRSSPSCSSGASSTGSLRRPRPLPTRSGFDLDRQGEFGYPPAAMGPSGKPYRSTHR